MDYAAGIQPRFPSYSRDCFQASELRSGALLQTKTAAQERWTQSSPVCKRVTVCIYPKGLGCCLQPEVMAKLRSAEDSALSHGPGATQHHRIWQRF